MAGWHHQCNEYELGQALGDGEGLAGLVCCSPWGHRESDTTGRVDSSNKHTQLCSNLFCFYICRNKSLVKSNTSEYVLLIQLDFPGGSDGKASVYNSGDPGSIPGSGRSPGEGNGTPLQYYCLENPMDRGAWQATLCGVAKSQTQLSVHSITLNKYFLRAQYVQGTLLGTEEVKKEDIVPVVIKLIAAG